MKRFIAGIGIIVALAFNGKAQNHNKQLIEDLVEELASGSLANLDYTEVVEDLSYYAEHPLNLNEASQADLEGLWALNTFQVKSLLYYRSKNGYLSSIYELALIDGLDYASIQRILPFVKVEVVAKKQLIKPKQIFSYGNHSVFFRVASLIETPIGYQELEGLPAKYKGSKVSLYNRYQFNYKKKVQFGFTAEKDAGESINLEGFDNTLDFYSMHLQIKDLGWVKNVVVGDYSAQFGQGVVMWSAMRNAKTNYVMNIIKHGAGLKKYSSVNENLFLRGGGVTIGSKAIDLTVFASHKSIDANLKVDSTLSDVSFFTTLTQDGIHATSNDMNTKDAVKESIVGSHLQWRNSFLRIGVTGLANRFDHPLLKTDDPQNKFSFAGKENYNLGANAEVRFKGIHFFSEVGMSKNGSTGLLVGSLLKMTDRAQVSVLYRDYKKDYQAQYAGAFAENSYVQNEKGFYLGTELALVKKWRLRAYYDFFQFPWLKLGVSSPSEGNEALVQLEYVSSRNMNMYWRYRNKSKQKDEVWNTGEAYVPPLVAVNNQQFRYQINYKISESWAFKNRLEFSFYKQENAATEKGFLLYQDIVCSPFKFPLSMAFRYAVFDTDSYNARLYAYENDLLYVFSVLPYYNSGTRTYLMLKYKVGEHTDVWLKYGRFWYDNTTEIGSGDNAIYGDTKSSIKFQIRISI